MPLAIIICTRWYWRALAIGPVVVVGDCGSPTTSWATAAAAICSASASLAAGTSMRDGALQLCPVLLIIPITPAVTALVSGASSRMMLADLPPSSSDTTLTVSAACLATEAPARVEPVSDTMSTSGCDDITGPIFAPSPWIRLNTPAGTPAAAKISAKICDENGASSLGLSTTVQPASSAGATLQTIWFIGQFHGVISAHTPTGSLTISVRPCCCSNG